MGPIYSPHPCPALWSRLGLFGMASAGFQPPPWEPVWSAWGKVGEDHWGRCSPSAHILLLWLAGRACVLRLGGWGSRKVPSFLHPLPIAELVLGRLRWGVWRNGRGRQRRLPSSLASAHSACWPGLALQASEPGTGDGHCQQMTERVLCVLSPCVQAYSPHRAGCGDMVARGSACPRLCLRGLWCPSS